MLRGWICPYYECYQLPGAAWMRPMPVVEYKSEDDGKIIEQFFHSMKSAPGAIWKGSRRFVRCIVPSRTQSISSFRPYVAYSKPRGLPGCKQRPDGRSVIETRAQEREVAKARGEEWE